jgi:hypothetical protein
MVLSQTNSLMTYYILNLLEANVKKILMSILMLFGFVSLAFCANDSLGVLGAMFVAALDKVPFLNQFSMQIYVIVVAGLAWLLRGILNEILKKVPTTWKWVPAIQGVGVNWFWKIAAWLVGKNILYYNAKASTPSLIPDVQKEVEKHLESHSPALKAANEALQTMRK